MCGSYCGKGDVYSVKAGVGLEDGAYARRTRRGERRKIMTRKATIRGRGSGGGGVGGRDGFDAVWVGASGLVLL